ncbi:MAG: dephospho-CoA kinase [Pseudomonadota bacterium]
MTFRLGLTGSIGMGKSTTAQMFVAEGCALWDADAAVHRMYGHGGSAVHPIGAAFPKAVQDQRVNRERLREIIAENPDALKTVEQIVHPLVAQDRAAFLEQTDADIAVLDIPLLFESGAQAMMDAVAVVTVPPQEQERRVLARGTMTKAQFDQIRVKQMPTDAKVERADYVIVTDTLEHARAQVQTVVQTIRAEQANA